MALVHAGNSRAIGSEEMKPLCKYGNKFLSRFGNLYIVTFGILDINQYNLYRHIADGKCYIAGTLPKALDALKAP